MCGKPVMAGAAPDNTILFLVFKRLYLPFVFFSRFKTVEGPEVSALACFCVRLAGIDAVLPGF